jgi:hypothetical protein
MIALGLDLASGQQKPIAPANQGQTSIRLLRKANGQFLDAKGLGTETRVFQQGMTFPLREVNLQGVVVEIPPRLVRFDKRDVEIFKSQAVAPNADGFIPGILEINKATFGPARGRKSNVKNALIRRIPLGGRLNKPLEIEVVGALFGKRDPLVVGTITPTEFGGIVTVVPQEVQILEVTYVFNGKVDSVQVPEGAVLVLPR